MSNPRPNRPNAIGPPPDPANPPGPPNPPPGPPPNPPPPCCTLSRNSWIRCCSSSSFPLPKSCVRPCPCDPATATDSVETSTPAPFIGKLESSLVLAPPPPFPLPPVSPPPAPPIRLESEPSAAMFCDP